ncbi:MAG: short-chain fatty acid transporter [Galactobacter sp.]|uniref:short-chain fatty acid transporter n=1 Tax=Galactobacter sp. TaxID=2676125 RepID=UPI0025BC5B26|nr:TIGR00366 family protein [Galactobacter sp.]
MSSQHEQTANGDAPAHEDTSANQPKKSGILDSVASFFTKLMDKYLPDPFVFAIGLTLLTFILAVTVQHSNPLDSVLDWGNGFWNLLAFTTQMAVILAAGYVLANSPVVDRLLDKIVANISKPKTAIIVATLVGGIGSYLNWGFGLIVGGVVARKLAMHVKGLHYPLVIASAYSGFTFYGLGLSATIPLTIATPGHPLEDSMGVVGLKDTIFSLPMIITTLVVLIVLPLLNAAMHPKPGRPVRGIGGLADEAPAVKAVDVEKTFSSRLNNSRILSMVIGLAGILYVVMAMVKGRSVDLDLVNFIILFLGIILLGTPIAYITKLNEGIKTVSGIILQFPFYAGIMAIMAGSGLVETISHWFVSISNQDTLPFWGLVSSFFINFFAPSGGGHWVIQGPFMIDAANQLGASIPETSMSVMLGNAWNDLVQPFWILPALAISKLKLKDIMGYTVIDMFVVGLIYIAAMFGWALLG